MNYNRKIHKKECQYCSVEYFTNEVRQKYCSRKCSASINNIKYPRKHIKPFKKTGIQTICDVCNRTTNKSKIKNHKKCRTIKSILLYGERTIESCSFKGKQFNYVKIRQHAHDYINLFNIKKECLVCKYSKYVELCHIKDIASFDPKLKLRDVNSINNICYLCPNHHKELDKKLISDEELYIIHSIKLIDKF